MKIVFTGDSITAAIYVTEAESYAKLVADALGASYANTAVSGSTAESLLWNLQARVLDHDPSSCVVMIGTNDLAWGYEHGKTLDQTLSVFLAAMTGIIDTLKAAGIHLVVLSPPIARPPRILAIQPAFTAALATLCANKRVAFVDVFARMQRDAEQLDVSFDGWWLWLAGLTPPRYDDYHLTAAGHQRIADLILDRQVPATATGTVMIAAMDTSFGNISGGTVKAQIKAAAIAPPPHACSKIRLTLSGHVDEPMQLGSIYIGHRTGAEAWDAASLVPVTYGNGATAFTVPQGGALVTDWIPFAWDRTSDLIVSFYGNGAGTADKLAAKSDANGMVHYKSGDEAAVADAAGFTSYANYLGLVSKVETDGF